MKTLLPILVWCLAWPLTAQQPAATELFLVKPYLQFGTKTSMAVLWETTAPATTTVRYGAARLGVKEAVLDQEVTLPGTRLMHEVVLTGLQAETNYFYQVITTSIPGQQAQTPVLSFKTAVQDSSAYAFALVGDTQRNNRTPWAWGKISALVWEDRPNFVVHAGDIVDQGLDKNDWLQNFFPNGQPLMSRIPIYTVLGNHEQDSPFFYQYMVAPQPEYYYTFTYGNAQFFMLDSNRDLSEGSEQYEWLEWALAQSKATWKIAIHHHPPYSSDSDDHGNTYAALSTLGTAARNLVPLYEKYGLDFCLFGHTHLYERSWPILENRINQKDGVVYINSGGAGGGLEAFAPTRSWFTVELQVTHHYCTFSIFDRQIYFKAIDHEGRVFDSFQMEKPLNGNDRASVVQPPAPHLKPAATLFSNSTELQMSAAFDHLRIHYTLDGSEPTLNSPQYRSPLTINNTAVVKARAYTQDGKASRVVTQSLRKAQPRPAIAVKSAERGLRFEYFEGAWQKLPDFKSLKALRSGTVTKVGLEEITPRNEDFAVVLTGFVEVPSTGLHTFYLNTDDGSKLYIDGELVVDHDGDHSAITKTGQTMLAAGKHQLRLEFFQGYGGKHLQAGMILPNLGETPFTPFQLFYQK